MAVDKYTKNIPTKAGYYWLWRPKDDAPKPVQVDNEWAEDELYIWDIAWDCPNPIEEVPDGSEWFGPIVAPKR